LANTFLGLKKEEEIKYLVLNCVKEDFILFVKELNVNPFNADIHIDIDQFDLGVTCRASITINGEERGHLFFKLQELTGCCKYLVSTNTYISQSLRSRGLSYKLQQIKNKIAVMFDYTTLMCTVVNNNTRELNVLHKSGWKCIDEGVNKRTNNNVLMFVKKVDYSE
jgi:hypothetical protein